MEKSILKVDGMACEHCVKAVNGAVGSLDGVESVAVDLETKEVTVTHDPAAAPLEKIKEEIEDQGYEIIG